MDLIVGLLVVCLVIWLVWRRRGRAGQPGTVAGSLGGPGHFAVDVVGESYYQDNIEAICGPRTETGERRTVTAILVPEPDNPKDPHAIRVDVDGRQVGYLSRDNAQRYRAELRRQGITPVALSCAAQIRGGWQRGNRRGHYGVVLDLPVIK